MKILRVNMSSLETTQEDLAEELTIVGGRGLSADILLREMAPDVDPLGPDAKLIFAGGPLAGTLAPSCGRISVGAKSPLTLGIKEANCGGSAMQKADRLGYRAIVIEGAPADGKLYVLNLTKDGASFEDGTPYKGMNNYELTKALSENINSKSTIMFIGSAGENGSTGASVGCTDLDGLPTRHAGRGGLGAVMGAKGLKAIMVDDSGAPQIAMADQDAYRAALKEFAEVIKSNLTLQNTSRYGTTGGIIGQRAMGTMPSKNYSSEQTEGFEALAGPNFEEHNKKRGGRMAGCMTGCLVRCSTVYHDPDGNHLTSALEYETLALLGTNLGIGDPDVVARLDRWCDDLGLDTIETGSALGVAASAGKAEFGNTESFYKLMEEIEQGTAFGNILAHGVVATCKELGIKRVPAFGGQAIPAHDPRATKSTGVTYSTSPMGADHTAGVSYDDRLNKEGQGKRSVGSQGFMGTMDTLGYCILAIPGVKPLMGFLSAALNARYGLNVEARDLFGLGPAAIKKEIEFNKGTEFGTAHQYPDFVRTEPLAPDNSVFDVDEADITQALEMLS